jgi:hypothetical protein
MKRSMVLLAALSLVAGACSSKKAPLLPPLGQVSGAAFSYRGAWSAGPLGVGIALNGTATAVVFGTTSVTASVFSAGQSYQIAVDGHVVGKSVFENCRCFKKVVLAKGLSPKLHIVTLTNLSLTDAVFVHAWFADPGGAFLQRTTVSTAPAGSFPAGRALAFFVQDTASLSIDTVPADVQFDVSINDRPTVYHVTLTRNGPTIGGVARSLIAWGLPSGVEHVSISVTSGTLTIRRVVLNQLFGGSPHVLADEQADRAPLLGVFGDSIGDGQKTPGILGDAGGFADQLASLRLWRLADRSAPGATATCYGSDHVGDIASFHPGLVIVSFGASDIAPPPPAAIACHVTLAKYTAAMTSIIDQLHRKLPGVPIYVQAILPSTKVDKVVRGKWNAALKALVSGHGATYFDPGAGLFPNIDYADFLNNRGHEKIAKNWASLLPPILGS